MRMLRRIAAGCIGMSAILGLLGGPAAAENRSIGMSGFDEVPVVITDATGRFSYRIDSNETQIEYTLSYEGINQPVNPANTVRFAHIHLGQQHTTGAVVVFLCTNEAPPANVPVPPPCPLPPGGSVSGVLTGANIIPANAQGLESMDLAGLIQAIRKGVAYVNAHTTVSPSGIIRGQFVGKH